MSDNKEIINCPACGKEMKKIYINDANCYLDICLDGCGGIFFDNREFEKFDEQQESIGQIVSLYKGKTYSKVDDDKTRTCPVCNINMVKHYANEKHEVLVDECYNCGGLFLDFGELDEIRKQYTTENERKTAFIEHFEKVHDVSDFKDYQPKDCTELFNKKGFHPVYNKQISKLADFVIKLL